MYKKSFVKSLSILLISSFLTANTAVFSLPAYASKQNGAINGLSSTIKNDLQLGSISKGQKTNLGLQNISGNKTVIQKNKYVTGEILVKYKNSKINLQTPLGRTAALNFNNLKKVETKEDLKSINTSILKIKDNRTVEEKILELKNDPNIEFAQPNFQYYPASFTSNINTNDTYKDNLWGLDNLGQIVNGITGSNDADIDMPEAWTKSEGNSSVIVAVIDTGVAYNHPDLASNMWNGTNCKDDSGNTLGGCNHGYDYEDKDKTPLPTSSWHGTHVAGTIAAIKNNSKGVIGVAPNSKIMAIKSSLTTFENVKAINFAKQNGAKVINASWGDGFGNGGYNHYYLDQSLYNAIKDFPGLFIASAGNGEQNHDSGNINTMAYPAGFRVASTLGQGLNNIIVVAATDQNDALATFSDYGSSSVDVGAPGVNILSTIAEETAVLNESFEGAITPNVPDGWVKGGVNNNWRTFYLGGPWGNILFSDLNYPYPNNINSSIITPKYDLTGGGANISFITACDTEYKTNGWYDYIAMDYSSDGANFKEILQWDEPAIDSDTNTSGFAMGTFSASVPDEYLTSNFKIKFRWVTNSSDNNYGGCLIDELKITKYSGGSDGKYDYSSGTSMASPHVAGLVALIEGYNSSLTNSQVKDIILTTGDSLDSLSNKTISGKRINAYNAMIAASPNKAKIEISANSSNYEKVAILNSGDTTNDIELGKFDIKATRGDAKLQGLKISIVSELEENESYIMPTIKIYDGSTLLSSQTVTSTGLVTFSGLALSILKDNTKTLTLKGDFNPIVVGNFGEEGASVIASLSGITETEIIAKNSDDLSISTENITAVTSIAKKIHTYTKAPVLSLVSTSVATTADTANKEADATITFRVTANGGDIYLNTAEEYDITKRAFSNGVTDIGSEASVMTFISSDATKTGSGDDSFYTIKNGETKTFTMSVHILSGNAGFYRAWLSGIRWGSVLISDSTRSANFWTWGIESFKTNDLMLTAGGNTIPDAHTISGTVKYYDGIKAVPNAMVALEDNSGTQIANTTTDTNGTYQFTNINRGGNYTIRVSKSDNASGLTSNDQIKIGRHIVGLEIFDSIYKTISGDVNNSGSLTSNDQIKIGRFVVGIDNTLPSGAWKFYSSDATLNASNYLTTGLTRSYSNLTTNLNNQNFIGIKMGDVNNSWINN